MRVLRSGDGDRGSLPISNSFCSAVSHRTVLAALYRAGRGPQGPKYRPNHLRVAPGNDHKGHKEANQVEDDAVWDVICKLLIDGVIPAVHVPLLVVQLRSRTVPAFPRPSRLNDPAASSLDVSCLREPEDGAGEDEDHHPHQCTGRLHHPLTLQSDGPHWVADPQVPEDGRPGVSSNPSP